MAAKLQCEICGGKLIGRPGGIFECDSCGMEYDTAWAKAKIQEITGTVKIEGTVEVTGKVQIDGPVKVEGGANKESLLQRGMMALEDKMWDVSKDCFNKVLSIDAECAEAYLGLAMTEASACDRNKFASAVLADRIHLETNRNISRARQFNSEYNHWFLELEKQRAEADKNKPILCKMCQGVLKIHAGATTCVCEYCGTNNTVL